MAFVTNPPSRRTKAVTAQFLFLTLILPDHAPSITRLPQVIHGIRKSTHLEDCDGINGSLWGPLRYHQGTVTQLLGLFLDPI